MSRRFYFTDDNGENVCNDYIGNIRGARTYAQKIADELNKDIFINDSSTDNIVDSILCSVCFCY